MELIWKSIAHDDTELTRYAERGAQLWGGVLYPIEYLRGGRVFGCYQDGTMVAGFALLEQPPFRTLSFLTEQMREGHRIFRSFEEDHFGEIAGIWYDASSKNLRRTSYTMWEMLGEEVGKMTKRYLVYGYNLERAGLQRIYARFRPIVLYRGPKSVGNVPGGNDLTLVSIEAVLVSRFSTVIPSILQQLSGDSSENASVRTPNRRPLSLTAS